MIQDIETDAAAPETTLAGSPDTGTLRDAHLVLIDGSGFIFRAFHALPPMNRADGTPVNAVFGFTNMIARFLRDHVGTHLAVIFDAGRLTFRNELYDKYKAHRPEPPPELVPQFALVREATAAFGIPAIELAGWEADDLIAAYARAVEEAGGRCTIVSSDKDLMQLIRPGIDMLDPIKQKTIGEAEVRERFGVGPDKVVEVQALMGDPVDNVPGVPGIGPKTAGALVAEFGDLEAILAAAPAMKPSRRREMLLEHADNARLSRRLVILRDDAPGAPPGGPRPAPRAPRRRRASRSPATRPSPPPRRCSAGSRRPGHPACAPSTPRPTGSIRCAPTWSASRSPPPRDAPATCRCDTRATWSIRSAASSRRGQHSTCSIRCSSTRAR